MIHIVFQRSDIDTLKKAVELNKSLLGDVVQIADDFAVGPLVNIYTDEGIEVRKQWWREVLAGGDYDGIVDDGSVADDNKTVSELIERLKDCEERKHTSYYCYLQPYYLSHKGLFTCYVRL